MHAYIITGGNSDTRQQTITAILTKQAIVDQDVITIAPESGSIGVSEIREFTRRLQLAPARSPFLAGIIQSGELLTTEAQNALLKTLEEPPPRVLLILQTANAQTLLPTILSRCLVKRVTGDTEASQKTFTAEEFETLKKASLGQRLAYVDAHITNRADAETVMAALTQFFRMQMLASAKGNSSEEGKNPYSRWLRETINASRLLTHNISPKLVLDWLFLSF